MCISPVSPPVLTFHILLCKRLQLSRIYIDCERTASSELVSTQYILSVVLEFCDKNEILQGLFVLWKYQLLVATNLEKTEDIELGCVCVCVCWWVGWGVIFSLNAATLSKTLIWLEAAVEYNYTGFRMFLMFSIIYYQDFVIFVCVPLFWFLLDTSFCTCDCHQFPCQLGSHTPSLRVDFVCAVFWV